MFIIVNVCIFILALSGLYRANEINPKFSKKSHKLATVLVMLTAYAAFYFVHRFKCADLLLVLISLLSIVLAVWLVSGRIWRS